MSGWTTRVGRSDETSRLSLTTGIDGSCPKCGEEALALTVVLYADREDEHGWPVYDETAPPKCDEAHVHCVRCYKYLAGLAEYFKLEENKLDSRDR